MSLRTTNKKKGMEDYPSSLFRDKQDKRQWLIVSLLAFLSLFALSIKANAQSFYGFYGVTKVAADIENATTTLNGGTLGSTKLSSVTKNVKLYFGEDKSTTNVFTALKVGDNGKFYYYNNGTTLGKFTIRVPLEVTYKWGTIYTEVDLNINKTIQN